ncbi:MAG TPA: carboxypeptidase regulatory-like domain-containing protein [Terracidiphilus sp.]|jgi:hypothetical protein|nr:carboxypeptidase regulatory-like domain-containing protein [Terracidiphilus sp.]
MPPSPHTSIGLSWARSQAARAAFFLALAFAFAATCAQAQYRASIQGVVTDQSGAVVPGAQLVLTNKATGQTQTRTSDSVGVYNFNALPPGQFKLVVERSGYQTKVLDNVQVIPEQANALNVALAIGAVAQSVTVDASTTPIIDTEGGSIGGTINENEIQHMPSFGRDVFQLTQLAPGSFGDASQSSGGGTSSLPATQGPGGPSSNGGIFQTENGPQTLANGGQYENNSISIDGISTVSAVWGGTSVVTPSEESVGDVRIVSNDYDAENGRFSGAQIQVTSKSGTNNVHGSAFFQAWRPGLNAYQRYNGTGFYNPCTDSNGNTIPCTAALKGLLRDEQQFNQMGGSVGGPLWKNKLFAFFAYETERNTSQATSTGWYETPAFDGLAPSGSIAASYLTYPGAGVSEKGLIGQSCSDIGLTEGVNCNTIPGQGLNIGSPLTSGLGKQDPSWNGPDSPGAGDGLSTTVADIAKYTTVNPTKVNDDQYNGRLDADITGKDRLTFAIYWIPADQTYYSGPVRPQNLWHHDVTNDAVSGIWNHTFSPNFLNEARANAAGWRYNEVASNPQAPFGLPTDSVQAIGSINLESFGAPGPAIYDQWTYSYRDVATKILGRHTVKFGGELTRLYYLNDAPYNARPAFGFFNVWDFLNDAPQSESGTFDPTTGLPTDARQDDREDLLGFFVQDNFKATPSLTLNLGLRYSYFGPLSAKQGNMYTTVLGSGSGLLTGLSVRKGGNLWNAQKGNFGPEFGFAYTPGHANKMVIRGGFGLNYNQNEIAITSNVNINPGLIVSPNFTMSTPSSPNPGIIYETATDVHSLFGYQPNPNTEAVFGSNGLPATGQVSVTAFDANMPTMYTEHYSLEAEYDMGFTTVASLGYQGSLSRHAYFQYNTNATASVQNIALNPQVSSVDFYGNNGHSNFNSMLASVKHQFSHQFMADVDYTWAKSMDTNSGPYFIQYYPYNPSLSYGRSDFNVGQAFKAYGMWQPVFFRGSHEWAEKLLGGWSISGIFNVHSGFPWTPVFSTPGSLYCSGCPYSQLLPAAYLGGAGHDTSNAAYKSGPSVGNGENKNFPLAASDTGQAYFAAPTYTLGAQFPATGGALPQAPGIARNSLTGPGYKDVDATVSKSFGLPRMPVLGEKAQLEFRADAYNLFNNLNFKPGGQSSGGGIADNISLKNFGQATSALGSRTVTLQARFSF